MLSVNDIENRAEVAKSLEKLRAMVAGDEAGGLSINGKRFGARTYDAILLELAKVSGLFDFSQAALDEAWSVTDPNARVLAYLDEVVAHLRNGE